MNKNPNEKTDKTATGTTTNTASSVNWASENDPFEEFEFKPLTEGLGFHAKNQSAKKITDGMTTGTTTKFTTEKRTTTTPQGLNKVEFKTSNLNFETNGSGATTAAGTRTTSPLQSPLPRPTTAQNLPRRSVTTHIPTIQDDSIAKAQNAVNDILKNLNHKKQQEEILAKAKKRLTWKDSTPSMVAAGLDAMLVVAGFLIALIAMLSITKIDLLINLSNPGQNNTLWLATAFLFASVHMIYMVVFRAYLGYTPGEWAYDQRCGTEAQQASYSYIFKVMLRAAIVTMTGYLPITLISAIIGKDLLAKSTGLQMQTQSYTQMHV